MPATPSRPDFERSPDQRMILGGYEVPSPPRIPDPPITFLDRIRAALRIPTKRRRGPDYRKPKGWAEWPDTGRVPKKSSSRRRPSSYEFPDVTEMP